MSKYKEIQCKIPLNHLTGRKGRYLPYDWDLNIYRGCAHQCKYCYAMYSHKYLDDEDFFKSIYIKTNICEKLEEKLSSKNWKREIINIGGITDSYQPIEKDRKTMREILSLLIKYKTPAIICTKSDIILRDMDLIEKLSHEALACICSTITTMNEDVRKKVEPGSSPSLNRFKVLEEAKKVGASTGLHTMPIIPYLTDDKENIEELFSRGKDVNIDYLLTGAMYLRGQTKPEFLNFIYYNYPFLFEEYRKLFDNKNKEYRCEYKNRLYSYVNPLKKKYGLSSDYKKPIKIEDSGFNDGQTQLKFI